MKYRVDVSKTAYRDMQRIQAYYDKTSPSAGAALIDRITAAIHSLEYMPLRCPVYHHVPKYRRMVIDKFLVFYVVREEKNQVLIRRVYDGRMDIQNRLRH